MKYLYIDTVSTTGVWLWKAMASDPSQPHLIRIAAALYEDETDHAQDSFCALIRPEHNWPSITADGYEKHHIEDADLRLNGTPLKSIMSRIANLIGAADLLVMQNAQFHQRMLWRTYADANLTLPDPLPRAFCTMTGAKDVMRSAKWVSLSEGYRRFTGEALELPADAFARGDVMVRAVRAVHLGIMAAKHPAAA